MLHVEHGVAEARGERRRAETSRLPHEEVGVYILLVPVSGNQGIPYGAEDHLLILVSFPKYQYPLPQHLPSFPDTPRSSSGAMTAKGTQSTNKVVFPSHLLHKSLYQPSSSPQTEGVSVRFAVAEQDQALYDYARQCYTRGVADLGGGDVYTATLGSTAIHR